MVDGVKRVQEWSIGQISDALDMNHWRAIVIICMFRILVVARNNVRKIIRKNSVSDLDAGFEDVFGDVEAMELCNGGIIPILTSGLIVLFNVFDGLQKFF